MQYRDKKNNIICKGDIIRGKYHGLGEVTIRMAIVREDHNWSEWEIDTVEVVGNINNAIQS